jgi:hypothetical protein
MELKYIEIPNLWYGIQALRHNIFKITLNGLSVNIVGGTTQSHYITIPDGNYTSSSLKVV